MWPECMCRAGGREENSTVAQVETSPAGCAYKIHAIHSCRGTWTNFEFLSWDTRNSINFPFGAISTDEKKVHSPECTRIADSGIVPAIIFKHELYLFFSCTDVGFYCIGLLSSFTHFLSYSDEKHNVSLHLYRRKEIQFNLFSYEKSSSRTLLQNLSLDRMRTKIRIISLFSLLNYIFPYTVRLFKNTK